MTDPTTFFREEGWTAAVIGLVPSPLGRNRQPDTSSIEAAAETIATVVHPGQLISLESTAYPGTTEDLILPAALRGGLTLDEDVFVAFSPERADPRGVSRRLGIDAGNVVSL